MALYKSGSLQEKIPPADDSLEGDSLKTLRYEETLPAKPPIPVTVAPPRNSQGETHPAMRSRPATGVEEHEPWKRDSGLAPTESTGLHDGSLIRGDEHGLLIAATNGAISLSSPPTQHTSSLEKSDSSTTRSLWKTDQRVTTPKTPTTDEDFSPITTPIPSNNNLDIDFNELSFSKRGSVLLRNKNSQGHIGKSQLTAGVFSVRALSEDVEKESRKVRSMYNDSLPLDWVNGRLSSPDSVRAPCVPNEGEVFDVTKESPSLKPATQRRMCEENVLSDRRISIIKREHELAGGIEDWEDVHGEDVDRYGFITIGRESARSGTPEPRAPQRISTVLQLASDTPRKRRGLGRTLSSSRTSQSVPRRSASRKFSARSLNTQATSTSTRSSRRPFRMAANRFPGNRDRRWMDEAGDMLTLPPGLADIVKDEDNGKSIESIKRKEWVRAEKWRKMAKLVKSGKEGEGMQFEFDVRNPKLIERTWKGIPDRWRATAWHSFLSASAKRRSGSATDGEITEDFHCLLEQGSADDVQIDMDVPRTINSHIMFRRRYRGGQRLLFRVLHCLSLYFPNTGYVQGMASLAATLLCYYDEEKTFIMLVRMWQLRGLDKLYEAGFAGLMAALNEFQRDWMNGHAVSKKLDELSIDPTAYGTRWYLTLFNYSIPFAAQLRVWDVFMLLGDMDTSLPATKERPFQGCLDIIHAASAALIDGTRDILLDSDFENAMKALTSWIPVKDEELFMKVAKAEWKLHHGKRRD